MKKILCLIIVITTFCMAKAEYYNGLQYQQYFFRTETDNTATVIGVDPDWPNTDIVVMDSVLLPIGGGNMKMFPVKHMKTGAISSDANITSLKFNNIGMYLEYWAIVGCTTLRKVEIPYNCTWDNNGNNTKMFDKCTGLDTIIINRKDIASCFNECDTINYIYFGPNVENFGGQSYTFYKTFAKNIVWNAKNGKSAHLFPEVETFILGDSVETIPPSLCSGMKNLKSVQLPKGLKEIPNRAFNNAGLEQIIIPDSVTRIGTGAFACTNITEITIAENVSVICNLAFSGCPNLKIVHYNAKQASIDDVWNYLTKSIFSNSNIDTIYIGSEVKGIPDYTFCEVATVKNITSYAVEAPGVGYSAFYQFEPVSDVIIPCEKCKNSYWQAWGIAPNFSPLKDNNVFSYMHQLSITQSANGDIEKKQLSCDSYTLTAIPHEGYHFVEWFDGVKDNPRTYNFTGHIEVTAIFEQDEVTGIINEYIDDQVMTKYDILGRPVDGNYQGIVIYNGQKKLKIQN